MPTFHYEAAGADGTLARGLVEASSRSAAVEKILGLGQTPVRVTQDADAAAFAIGPQATLLPQFSSSNDRLRLLQEFSILLKAGLTVERALTTCWRCRLSKI